MIISALSLIVALVVVLGPPIVLGALIGREIAIHQEEMYRAVLRR